MPTLDFIKTVKALNTLFDTDNAIIKEIKTIHKIQMLVVFGVFILSLGSCSREYRIGRLQDRVETLEHENSVLETMVHNLENKAEGNK